MYFKAIRIAHSLTKLFLARCNRPDALEFCDKPGFVFTIPVDKLYTGEGPHSAVPKEPTSNPVALFAKFLCFFASHHHLIDSVKCRVSACIIFDNR